MRIPDGHPSVRRRAGHSTSVTISGERLAVIGVQREDGTLGEVLLRWGKQGSAQAGLADAYATAISAGLQYGVPLGDLLRAGIGLRFAPSGRTDDPEIPWASSVADYLCRRLAIDWLSLSDRTGLGILTLTERVRRAAGRIGADEPAQVHPGRAGTAGPGATAPSRSRRAAPSAISSSGSGEFTFPG